MFFVLCSKLSCTTTTPSNKNTRNMLATKQLKLKGLAPVADVPQKAVHEG